MSRGECKTVMRFKVVLYNNSLFRKSFAFLTIVNFVDMP
jgi:hypothetical protein